MKKEKEVPTAANMESAGKDWVAALRLIDPDTGKTVGTPIKIGGAQ